VAAEDDRADKIHGFVIARCGIDDWEIENIVVAQERRRHGVGGALVQEMLQKALQAGATAVSLEVRESNRPARVLYEKLGFSEAGRRRDYYRNPSEDALLLRISIAVP
jgi:ribosomal-protein-alanine N-acetyltransferase